MNRNTRKSFFRTTVFALLLMPVLAWADPAAFQVKRVGQGVPMILIPGLASSGEVWDATAQHFSPHYECHVLTLAGFAGVAPIKEPLLSSVEQELVAYIGRNHLQRPIIVGHSLGGVLAMRLAADHPELVSRILIVDSLPALGATQNPAATAAQLDEAAQKMRTAMLAGDPASYAASQRKTVEAMVTRPADVERVLGWGQASDRVTVINALAEVLRLDLRQDISKIQAPTLVLGTWIEYQEYAPRSAIEATFRTQYQKLPGVRIELADTARHFIMLDDPAWMLGRMDAFLVQ
jgi:pimeloyl-ACP methyl ester carboxylesterase